MGRRADGIGLIDKVLRLSLRDPLVHELLLGISAAHFVTKRYEEAVVCANQSLEWQADQPEAYGVRRPATGRNEGASGVPGRWDTERENSTRGGVVRC